MPRTLTTDQLLRLRTRAQGLHWTGPEPRREAVDVVRDMAGAQAQDQLAGALSVHVRSRALTAANIRQAREQDRTIVRTWCMRGTLHLIAAADLRWLLALYRPVLTAATRRRRAELGLDEETSERGARLLRDALASRGPMTRAEIVDLLTKAGIPREGQATIHLIGYAAATGILCQGPDRGRQTTFVLLDDWLDPRDAAPGDATTLARRYLGAFGPATPVDFATWSGLPMSVVRPAWGALASELIEVEHEGQTAWMLASQAHWLDEPGSPAPVVRLLPAYDTYLLGYRSRSLILPDEHAHRIKPGGGVLAPTILIDGRLAGSWKLQRYTRRIELIVEPFEPLDDHARREIEAETERIGRFLDSTTTLRLLDAAGSA